METCHNVTSTEKLPKLPAEWQNEARPLNVLAESHSKTSICQNKVSFCVHYAQRIDKYLSFRVGGGLYLKGGFTNCL